MPAASLLLAFTLALALAPVVRGVQVARDPQAAPAPAPAASTEKVALRFDWRPEGEVPVVETRRQDGGEIRIAYLLRWRTRAQDRSLVVEHVDLRLESFNGRPLSDPVNDGVAPRLEPLLRAVPRMRIDRDGAFAGIEDYDEIVTALAASLATEDPDLVDAIRNTLASPAVRATAAARCAEQWNAWIGSWNGLELPVGVEMEYESPLPVGDAIVTAKTGVVCTRTGVREGVLEAELVSETVLRGDAVTASLAAVLAQGRPGLPEGFVQNGSKVTVVRGEHALERLLPRTVSVRASTAFDTPEGTVETVEQRAYVFDWTKYRVPPAPPVPPVQRPPEPR